MSEPVPFVASHVTAVLEGVRLLESLVTAPLGLHSDIKMMRQSMPLADAADLGRDEERERRISYGRLTDAPLELALHTISSISVSLDALETAAGGGSPLGQTWVSQARSVLSRADSRVSGDLRTARSAAVNGLYVIVDPEATRGRPVDEVAEATLKGGASLLQLRDKTGDKGDVLREALELREMCARYDALFVINDDADVARASDAHGLHVGQDDLPVRDARRVLSPLQIVGRSNNTLDEAMESQAQEVDYIAVGAVYPTATMGKQARFAVGPELVREVKERVGQPVVAIGGIDDGNVEDVIRAGADCICAVSAVTMADDPQEAAANLVDAIQRASAQPA